MFGKGWITATRQRWKLVVLYVLTLVGLFSAVGGLVPSVGQLVTRDRDLSSDVWDIRSDLGRVDRAGCAMPEMHAEDRLVVPP